MGQTNKWDVLYKLVTTAGKIAIAYIIFRPALKKDGGGSLITINLNGKKEIDKNVEKRTEA